MNKVFEQYKNQLIQQRYSQNTIVASLYEYYEVNTKKR